MKLVSRADRVSKRFFFLFFYARAAVAPGPKIAGAEYHSRRRRTTPLSRPGSRLLGARGGGARASDKVCGNGNCAAEDPITGSTFCTGPTASDGCDFERGCPRFNDIASSDTANVKRFVKKFIDDAEADFSSFRFIQS